MEKIISDDIYSYESNDFFVFYQKIVSGTKFKRLLNNQVDDYIKSNNLTRSVVIYEDQTYSIIYQNPTLTSFSDYIYMIADPNDSHRYFLGIMVHGYCTSIKIYGNFVYFNSLGDLTELILVPKMLLSFDYRNGRVDKSNTFLYNQSLVFVESHRDTRSYMITVCAFGYYDDLLATYTEHTQIKSKYFSFDRNIKQFDRFLFIGGEDDKSNYLLDMGSTLVEKKNPESKNIYSSIKLDLIMKYSLYELEPNISIDNISSQLIIFKSKPEQIYSDSYVNNCIKCGVLTGSAVFYDGNMSLGLGKSYCHECGIRYSLSDNKWVCAKLSLQNNAHYKHFCAKEVKKESGYICDCEHSKETLKFEFNLIEKKPYKKNGSVTIIKNENLDSDE